MNFKHITYKFHEVYHTIITHELRARNSSQKIIIHNNHL